MHPELLKLNSETREKFLALFTDVKVKELIASTKDATDSGSFTGLIVSTEDQDRQGEIVRQAGIDTTDYWLNPVILNSHCYAGIENIVGVTTRLYPGTVNGVPATLADGKFSPTAEGQMARALWDGGFLNAASVGFIPTEFDPTEKNVITKWQLLEYSFVPVPANGKATRLRTFKDLGLEESVLRAKGFVIDAKSEETEAVTASVATEETLTEETTEKPAPEETPIVEEKSVEKAVELGGTCTLDDGSEGIYVENPDDATVFICAPKEDATKGAVSDELNETEVMEAKYSKLDEFFEVIYAFVDVFMDEETTVDQYDTLLAETISLLQKLPAVSDDTAITASMKKGLTETTIKYISIKAGRTISANTGKILQNAIETLKEVTDTHLASVSSSLGELAKANETDGSEMEKGTSAENHEVNDFVFARTTLRKFSYSLDKVLEDFNKRATS
jgi:hypothetical protein